MHHRGSTRTPCMRSLLLRSSSTTNINRILINKPESRNNNKWSPSSSSSRWNNHRRQHNHRTRRLTSNSRGRHKRCSWSGQVWPRRSRSRYSLWPYRIALKILRSSSCMLWIFVTNKPRRKVNVNYRMWRVWTTPLSTNCRDWSCSSWGWSWTSIRINWSSTCSMRHWLCWRGTTKSHNLNSTNDPSRSCSPICYGKSIDQSTISASNKKLGSWIGSWYSSKNANLTSFPPSPTHG